VPGYDAAALSDAAAFAERWLAFRCWRERVPGVQVAIRHHGELVASFACGVADETTSEPLTTAHRFRIASHSKMATATIVGRLVQDGVLRFDDRVDQHVAGYEGTAMGERSLRELLSHAGGIRRDGMDADHWQLARPFPDGGRLVELATDDAEVLDANVRCKYSNIGFGVLGQVVEGATGASFSELLERFVTRPLGLTDTGADLDDPALQPGRIATGHTSLGSAATRIAIDQVGTGALAAATGLVSTAEDVTAFLAAHALGDDRLVTDQVKRQLHRSVQAIDAANADTGYGLGFQVQRIEGRTWVGHGGGWPGHITRSLLDPEEGLAVSVLTNAIDGPAAAWATAIVKILGLAAAAPPLDVGRAALATYEGRWASIWRVNEIVAIGGRLVSMSPESPDPVVEQQRLEVVDADTLRYADDGPGLAAPGELVRYERAADGTVRSIRSAGSTMHPTDALRVAIEARAADGVAVRQGSPVGGPA
jgi:D-alanyl-D-alanine carboxypeptidase